MTTTATKPILRRGGLAKIKIQQLPGGQLVVSIPQALGTALDLKKGEEIVWKLEGKRLYMERSAFQIGVYRSHVNPYQNSTLKNVTDTGVRIAGKSTTQDIRRECAGSMRGKNEL